MKAQIVILSLLAAGTAMAQDQQGNRPPPRGAGGFIKHFDQDGDNKVSQDEFKGPDEHFTHLDKNGDGYVDETEAPKGPPPRRGQGQKDMQQGPQRGGQRDGGFIKHFDTDGDGKVSQEEFTGPDEHFTHLDKNGDGYVDEAEAPKGPPPQNGDAQQGPPPGGGDDSQCPPPGGSQP